MGASGPVTAGREGPVTAAGDGSATAGQDRPVPGGQEGPVTAGPRGPIQASGRISAQTTFPPPSSRCQPHRTQHDSTTFSPRPDSANGPDSRSIGIAVPGSVTKHIR